VKGSKFSIYIRFHKRWDFSTSCCECWHLNREEGQM